MKTNRSDVVHVEDDVVDASGVFVPEADPRIEFSIDGPARLISVENGDILDLSPHKVSYRKAFRGKCLAMVQVLDTAGEITVTASLTGLHSSRVTVVALP